MTTEKKRTAPNPVIYVAVVCVALLAFFYLVFGNPSFLAVASNSSQTQIVTQTETSVNTISTTTTSIGTASFTSTEFVTVTKQLPPSVTLSGDVKTSGLNTTPTDIIFTSTGANSSVFRATITGSHYSIQLTNSMTYQVKIHYTINPVGSGDCNVGAMLIDTTAVEITTNITC